MFEPFKIPEKNQELSAEILNDENTGNTITSTDKLKFTSFTINLLLKLDLHYGKHTNNSRVLDIFNTNTNKFNNHNKNRQIVRISMFIIA